MKKTFFLILCIFCFIGIANAKMCTIVSGTGKDIGDEIDCAGERFYIIENKNDSIRALAKYNLYAGWNYIKTENYSTTASGSELDDEIENTCSAKGDGWQGAIVRSQKKFIAPTQYYCYKWEEIEEEPIKQNEQAIGAHGGTMGSPALEEKGIMSFYPEDMYSDPNANVEGKYYYNFDFATDRNGTQVKQQHWTLTSYQQTLSSLGINISNIDILTVNDIDDLVYATNKTRLPLNDWTVDPEAAESVHGNYVEEYYIMGSISDYLSNKYSWLWSTTYWTRTMYVTGQGNSYLNGYVYFVDTLGNMCSAMNCNSAVGAGMRPVITISKENVSYKVETKTDGNGEIKATKVEANGGEVIKFTVTPKEGYVLGVVKVTDANGNVLTFTDYEFTMPYANVLIEATFTKVNPETGDIMIIGISIIAILSLISVIVFKKKITN